MQDFRRSSVLAMESLQFYTEPSMSIANIGQNVNKAISYENIVIVKVRHDNRCYSE